MRAELIMEALERGSVAGDPSPAVYARVFAVHPEMESLFVRDRDGSVRGHMFQEMILALIDYLGPNTYGGNLFRIEHTNHENLGVPPHIYPLVFDALRDELKLRLKSDWTSEMDSTWSDLLHRIRDLLK